VIASNEDAFGDASRVHRLNRAVLVGISDSNGSNKDSTARNLQKRFQTARAADWRLAARQRRKRDCQATHALSSAGSGEPPGEPPSISILRDLGVEVRKKMSKI
jgi:hypothetical protein